ncbi:ABC transporter ATP-binding protein [Lacticaseibacillus rhamnosus]|uniref:ABC transporter ATP-binding protein n=1 Tax=Lacticaseibacillus rhamnosus TaxID=47715 RepID=UPI0006655E79|nr:ABC transporter ATP-binding protein [Lacticaseibacillus rhamnosus]WHM90266.1 ABC transporter ATP-binding protein [Lacticaseibacillus rhamnosus]
MILLETTNLTKTYGTKTVVNDISLKIQAGQLVAFLGPNGAGKSTTLGMLTGLIQPSSGKITMGTATPNQAAYRQQIGVVFQDSRLDRQLTVKENLKIRSQMYAKTDPTWFDHLIDQFDLTPILNQAYGTLSGGQRRRVDIARALLNHPRLLFLDEPTTGLDIQTRQTIWTAIASLRAQSQLTVILTTHYLEETEQANFVYVIDQGTIIAANTVGQLKQKYAGHQLIVRTHAPQQVQIAATQANLPARIDGDTVRVQVSHPQAAITLLTTIQPQLIDFEFRAADMNTIFVALTGKEIR